MPHPELLHACCAESRRAHWRLRPRRLKPVGSPEDTKTNMNRSRSALKWVAFPAVTSLIFLLWLLGAVGPFAGRLADRLGWRRATGLAVGCAGAGIALTWPATLPTFALGLALLTLAMFSGVTALQLGAMTASAVDRGAASAVYFSIYYGSGAFGAYVPGLAWQAWRWDGVAGVGLGAVALAAASLLSSRGTASARRRASRRARSATTGTRRGGSRRRRGCRSRRACRARSS